MRGDMLHQFAEQGFVVVPGLLGQDRLEELREASTEAAQLARSGSWPYVRTLPLQFPPWNAQDAKANGIWGVQHLMHPDMPGSATFVRSYFESGIRHHVRDLVGTNQLTAELYNLLVQPDHDFELRWHRDDLRPDASDEEEMAVLSKPQTHAQWNLALYKDQSLLVVPGSHKRARTAAERSAGPYEAHMPGAIVVTLEPGDVVFYNNNILHRGVYDSQVPRMTLHGSMGSTLAGSARSRNVLQHGVGQWIERLDLSSLDELTRATAEQMVAHLVTLAASNPVQYSQQDNL